MWKEPGSCLEIRIPRADAKGKVLDISLASTCLGTCRGEIFQAAAYGPEVFRIFHGAGCPTPVLDLASGK